MSEYEMARERLAEVVADYDAHGSGSDAPSIASDLRLLLDHDAEAVRRAQVLLETAERFLDGNLSASVNRRALSDATDEARAFLEGQEG